MISSASLQGNAHRSVVPQSTPALFAFLRLASKAIFRLD